MLVPQVKYGDTKRLANKTRESTLNTSDTETWIFYRTDLPLFSMWKEFSYPLHLSIDKWQT